MSQLIYINTNISEDLLTKGFNIVKSNDFYINASLKESTYEFVSYYNNLKIDKYIKDKENKSYRKRRYGSLTFNTQNNSLIPNKHKKFFQSKGLNKTYGGINRDFSPIEEYILNNKFLHELIKADFSKLPKSEQGLSNEWFIGIQMFRIEASKNNIGNPTPEGIHQDGHHFVIQHMINKKNVKGGKSTIYTLDKKEIESVVLSEFLDSCYVKDSDVMHAVSGISCLNNDNIAIRDMLILDFKLNTNTKV